MTSSSEPEAGDRALRAVAIVPARLSSTRLPKKMLLRETGSYLFEHTVRNIEGCPELDGVYLATDADEIIAAADEVGVAAILTAEHRSGTDRVHEALGLLIQRGLGPWDVVVNIQGDEPELPVADVTTLVRAFEDPDVHIATLCTPIEEKAEAVDPSVVKVVFDGRGDALYFSRSAIPSLDHPTRPMRPGAEGLRGLKRHVGVYAFRPPALQRFCELPTGSLEATENLEQLRWLENGGTIRVLEARRSSPGIDTIEQYNAYKARIEKELPLEGTRTP